MPDPNDDFYDDRLKGRNNDIWQRASPIDNNVWGDYRSLYHDNDAYVFWVAPGDTFVIPISMYYDWSWNMNNLEFKLWIPGQRLPRRYIPSLYSTGAEVYIVYTSPVEEGVKDYQYYLTITRKDDLIDSPPVILEYSIFTLSISGMLDIISTNQLKGNGDWAIQFSHENHFKTSVAIVKTTDPEVYSMKAWGLRKNEDGRVWPGSNAKIFWQNYHQAFNWEYATKRGQASRDLPASSLDGSEYILQYFFVDSQDVLNSSNTAILNYQQI